MHRWHAPRLVRSARHGVAVNTGWERARGGLACTYQGVAEEARCQRAWHQRAKLIWVVCSTVLGLQECFSYSRVSHMPRCVVPFMGSLQHYNKQIRQ